MRNLNESEMEIVSGGLPFIVLPLIVISIPAPAGIPSSTPN